MPLSFAIQRVQTPNHQGFFEIGSPCSTFQGDWAARLNRVSGMTHCNCYRYRGDSTASVNPVRARRHCKCTWYRGDWTANVNPVRGGPVYSVRAHPFNFCFSAARALDLKNGGVSRPAPPKNKIWVVGVSWLYTGSPLTGLRHVDVAKQGRSCHPRPCGSNVHSRRNIISTSLCNH